ncbi:8360_t:CDS:2, partial [Entrophospora sp. SA101]
CHGISSSHLRKIGCSHAVIVHEGKNNAQCKRLCQLAVRHKIINIASDHYSIMNSGPSVKRICISFSISVEKLDSVSDFEPESQISTPQPKNNDLSKKVHYNPFDVQIAEIDSMLAEINVK